MENEEQEETMYVTIELSRYEELLHKEFLANSILHNDNITEQQVKWLKENYEATIDY